jgi:hypothetical protein
MVKFDLQIPEINLFWESYIFLTKYPEVPLTHYQIKEPSNLTS